MPAAESQALAYSFVNPIKSSHSSIFAPLDLKSNLWRPFSRQCLASGLLLSHQLLIFCSLRFLATPHFSYCSLSYLSPDMVVMGGQALWHQSSAHFHHRPTHVRVRSNTLADVCFCSCEKKKKKGEEERASCYVLWRINMSEPSKRR